MSEDILTVTAEDQRKSNPKAAMVRAEVRSSRGYANQRAHDLRIGPQPDYVDASRSHLNRIILEPPTAPEMRKLVEERRAQRETSRALKSNAGIAVIGIIGFGIEAARLFAQLTPEQQDQALVSAGHAIAAEANTTMEGLVYHLDETSGHAHISFCGFDLDGAPLSSTMKRGMLAKFQDRLAEIMAEHCPGIERGNSKWARIEAGANFAETLHKTVHQLHVDLPKDIAAKQQTLDALTSQIPELTSRVEEMQARVDKLENEEKQRELTAAKVKRLRIYRGRLTDRVQALRSARDELTRLTKEIEDKQNTVTELETRASQTEAMAATAAERLQEARDAAKAAEMEKTETEASAAALRAQRDALGADISALTEAKAQLQPEVNILEKRKSTLQAEISRSEGDAAEASKRATQAQHAAKEAETRKGADLAALEALRAQKGALERDTQELAAAKAQLQPEITDLMSQKETILNEGRKLLNARKALETQVADLEEARRGLAERNNALEIQFADIQDSLEILRPALQAADILQQMSVLDLDEQHDAWAMMASPDRGCSHLEHASAIRMIDPLFAPDIVLRRSRDLNENLEILQGSSQELYDAVLEAVMSEDGSEAGAEAIWTRSVYLSNQGEVAASATSEPDILGKAFRWAKTAFEGVKRGVGLAIAATRDGISEELTAARASLFSAFEPKVQSALRRLLRAEGGALNPTREDPDLGHSMSDGFEP